MYNDIYYSVDINVCYKITVFNGILIIILIILFYRIVKFIRYIIKIELNLK